MNGCAICGEALQSRFRWQGFQTLRCRGCGTESTDPVPTDAELASFYQGFNSRAMNRWRDKLELVRPAMAAYLDSHRRVTASAPRTLLDLGGGVGYWVKAATDMGLRSCLMDVGTDAVAFAREVLELPWVVEGDIREAASLIHDTFDLVLCRHAIEHVPDPEALLGGIAALVAPDGLLEIETPDAGSREQWAHPVIVARNLTILRRDNPDVPLARLVAWAAAKSMSGVNPPKHLWGFTSRSLCMLLARAGFEVVTTRSEIAGHAIYDPLYWEVNGRATRRGLGVPYYYFERLVAPLFRGRGMNLAILARRHA